jgi:hypothetical protein
LVLIIVYKFKKMKKYFLIALTLVATIPVNAQVKSIACNVQVIQPYCGGARPTEQMEQNARTPHAYVGKKFYIRKGKINTCKAKIIDSFTTDAQGNFIIKLPKGTYSIILAEQKNELNESLYNTKFQKADMACLQKWWSAPYYILMVKAVNKPLDFLFTNRCYIKSDAPCLQYNGPLHP